jgi:hypothetical protein
MKEALKKLTEEMKAAGYKDVIVRPSKIKGTVDIQASPVVVVDKKKFAGLELVRKAGLVAHDHRVFSGTVELYYGLREKDAKPKAEETPAPVAEEATAADPNALPRPKK